MGRTNRTGGSNLFLLSRQISVVLLIVLLVVTLPGQVTGQAAGSHLVVTYIWGAPRAVAFGGMIAVDFDVVYFTQDAYMGNVSNPAVGIQTGSFVLAPACSAGASVLGAIGSLQVSEHPDIPLSPGEEPGNYHAEIQITQGDPVGEILVYVKAESLRLAVNNQLMTGPGVDTSSEQTYDTSDVSLLQIGQSPSPSPFEKLLQGNELLLVLLAAIVLLLLAISLLVRRKGKPAK